MSSSEEEESLGAVGLRTSIDFVVDGLARGFSIGCLEPPSLVTYCWEVSDGGIDQKETYTSIETIMHVFGCDMLLLFSFFRS